MQTPPLANPGRRRALMVGRRMAVIGAVSSAFKLAMAPSAHAAVTCPGVTNDYAYAGQSSVPQNYEGIARDISLPQGGTIVPNPQSQHVALWMDENTYTDSCQQATRMCWTQVGIGHGDLGGNVNATDALYGEGMDTNGYQIFYYPFATLSTNNDFKVYNTQMIDGNGHYEWIGNVQQGSQKLQLVETAQAFASMPIEANAEIYTPQVQSTASCPHIQAAGMRGASFGASASGDTSSTYAMSNSFDGQNFTLWTGAINPTNNGTYMYTQIKANYAFKATG